MAEPMVIECHNCAHEIPTAAGSPPWCPHCGQDVQCETAARPAAKSPEREAAAFRALLGFTPKDKIDVPRLTWQEPLSVRQILNDEIGLTIPWIWNILLMFVVGLGCTGFTYVTFLIHGNMMFPSWWHAVGAGLGIGFLVAVVLPALAYLLPYHTTIDHEGIHHSRWVGQMMSGWHFPWCDIRHLSYKDDYVIGDEPHALLLIHTMDAKPFPIALADEVSKNRLITTLNAVGFQLSESS